MSIINEHKQPDLLAKLNKLQYSSSSDETEESETDQRAFFPGVTKESSLNLLDRLNALSGSREETKSPTKRELEDKTKNTKPSYPTKSNVSQSPARSPSSKDSNTTSESKRRDSGSMAKPNVTNNPNNNTNRNKTTIFSKPSSNVMASNVPPKKPTTPAATKTTANVKVIANDSKEKKPPPDILADSKKENAKNKLFLERESLLASLKAKSAAPKKDSSSSSTSYESSTESSEEVLPQKPVQRTQRSNVSSFYDTGGDARPSKAATREILARLNEFKNPQSPSQKKKIMEDSEPEKAQLKTFVTSRPRTLSKSKKVIQTSVSENKLSASKSAQSPLPPDDTVVTDVGGNTFELFRKIAALRTATKQVESDEETPESAFTEKSDSFSASEDEKLNQELIAGYASIEDMNKNGMIRGKKGIILRGQKGKRYQMEDAHFCSYPFQKISDLGLFCVFDGHAGKDCSLALTKIFPKIFFKHWTDKKENTIDLTELWFGVYKEVDENLKKYQDEGSTATTVLIWRSQGKRYLQSANVGDSTAYLYRDGSPICISRDHKPTEVHEKKRISDMGIKLEEKATRVNGLGVSRALGDHFPKEINSGIIGEPYVCPLYELGPKDMRVIVASDGLWDVVTATRAYDIIKGVKDAEEAAKKLLRTALNSNKCYDNVTIIVVNLK